MPVVDASVVVDWVAPGTERRRTQLVTADAALRELLRGFDWIVGPEDLLRQP